jgi:hypothetical protein
MFEAQGNSIDNLNVVDQSDVNQELVALNGTRHLVLCRGPRTLTEFSISISISISQILMIRSTGRDISNIEFDGRTSKHREIFPEARVIEFSVALNMQR